MTITDSFRAYDTIEEAVEDYMDLLCSLSRYSKAVNETDAKKTITAIKNGGYATSPTYISAIMNIINKHNLTQYDSVVAGNVSAKRPTLKKGSRGADVIYLQQKLKDSGYPVGNVDGIFGIKTLEAVKAFQADSGLVVDGIVGVKTWSAIG